jgi:hypothetical protein
MWHTWGKGEVYTGIGFGNLTERSHLEELDVNGRMKWTFKK